MRVLASLGGIGGGPVVETPSRFSEARALSTMMYPAACAIALSVLAAACGGQSDGNREPDAGSARRDAAGNPREVGRLAPPAGSLCSADGFCWVSPQPVGFDLQDVWGPNADDLWAVGAGGSMLHWDGTAWSWHRLDITDETLEAVWGFSSDDIWVVGGNGFIGHYDGVRWTRSETPSRAFLHGLWGKAPHDLWAIGEPNVLLHYDGRRWSEVEAAADERLRALAGWGDELYLLTERTLLRREGERFTPLYQSRYGGVPDEGGGPLYFLAMHVSEEGLVLSGTRGGLYRWVDGPIEIGNTSDRVYENLWSRGQEVWAATGRDLVHVASDGLETHALAGAIWGFHGWENGAPVGVGWRGQVVRWEADRRRLDPAAVADLGLVRGLYAPNEREAWAAFARGVLHCLEDHCTVAELGEGVRPVAIWGSSPEDVWAVSHDGSVHRFDGTLWGQPLPKPEGEGAPLGIGGSGPDDVWIAGRNGLIWHFDGEGWTEVPSPTERNLRAVWALSPDDVWIVGGSEPNDIVLHYDGERLSIIAHGLFAASLYAVTGSGPDDVWVAGRAADAPLLAHFDGEEWTRRRVPSPPFVVSALAVDGEDAVWVAAGKLWRVDANGITSAAGGFDGVRSVVVGGTSVWAAGMGGVVLRADTTLLQ